MPLKYSSSRVHRPVCVMDNHRPSTHRSFQVTRCFSTHDHDHQTSKGHRQGTMDKLPQELVDKIIGSINRTEPDGRLALLTCSCVSRSWRWQAQKELFSSVCLSSRNRLRRWSRKISLENQIPSYTRFLDWAIGSYREFGAQDPFLEIEFPGRFASFSNLRILSLLFICLHSLDNATIARTFSPLGHSLQSLYIDFLTTDPDKWCFLISILPNLQCICLISVDMLEGGPGPDQDNPLSFNFTGHIARYNHRTERFFRCISGFHPRFRSIEIDEINDALVETLNLVIESCSTILTIMSMIRICPWEGNQVSSVCGGCCLTKFFKLVGEAMKRLALSSCTNLRVLRIDSNIATPSILPAILDIISSKHFKKLTIGALNQQSWWEFDQVLRLFAERLYKLGAVKPLTIALDLPTMVEGKLGELYVQSAWPLFSEVGVIVQEDWSLWAH